jgi:hypothetical protein
MTHAAAGGPRGRESASTVAGAKRHATSGHGAFEISTGQKTEETAGGARTNPGPALQNTQWVSSARPSGAPGRAGAALSCRQSSKPAQSAPPAASGASRTPAIAKAMPCRSRAKIRRHAVRRRLCHPCPIRNMPITCRRTLGPNAGGINRILRRTFFFGRHCGSRSTLNDRIGKAARDLAEDHDRLLSRGRQVGPGRNPLSSLGNDSTIQGWTRPFYVADAQRINTFC